MDRICNIKYVDAHYSCEPDPMLEYYSHKEDLGAINIFIFSVLTDMLKSITQHYRAFIKKGYPLETIKVEKKLSKRLNNSRYRASLNLHTYGRDVLKEIKTGIQ